MEAGLEYTVELPPYLRRVALSKNWNRLSDEERAQIIAHEKLHLRLEKQGSREHMSLFKARTQKTSKPIRRELMASMKDFLTQLSSIAQQSPGAVFRALIFYKEQRGPRLHPTQFIENCDFGKKLKDLDPVATLFHQAERLSITSLHLFVYSCLELQLAMREMSADFAPEKGYFWADDSLQTAFGNGKFENWEYQVRWLSNKVFQIYSGHFQAIVEAIESYRASMPTVASATYGWTSP